MPRSAWLGAFQPPGPSRPAPSGLHPWSPSPRSQLPTPPPRPPWAPGHASPHGYVSPSLTPRPPPGAPAGVGVRVGSTVPAGPAGRARAGAGALTGLPSWAGRPADRSQLVSSHRRRGAVAPVIVCPSELSPGLGGAGRPRPGRLPAVCQLGPAAGQGSQGHGSPHRHPADGAGAGPEAGVPGSQARAGHLPTGGVADTVCTQDTCPTHAPGGSLALILGHPTLFPRLGNGSDAVRVGPSA